jgi:hypothetical protein
MPRLMSVAYTTPQVVARIKTQTRRVGWRMLEAGDELTLCPKVMGRKGAPLERIVTVEVTEVRREPLAVISAEDVAREGFPDWTPADFIDFFVATFRVPSSTELTVISWRYPQVDLVRAEALGS